MLLFNHISIMLISYWILHLQPVNVNCKSLQTIAARLIIGSGPRTSRNPMYKSLSWISLQHRQDFHKCVMVYKCRYSLAPSYLEKLFTSNDTKHTYNTRHSLQLRSTKIGTSYYHRSFTVSGPKVCNELPSTIQNFHHPAHL